MNVTLKPELERFVEAKLQSGRYVSASDVINDALQTLMGQEEIIEDQIDTLRAEVMIGIEEHRRGESTPLEIDAIKAAVRQRR